MARVTIIISLVVTLFVLNAAAIGAPTGPNDTLFNEQGEAFFPQFPSKPGVDCEPDQVIAQFLNNALSLPDKVEEANFKECQIEKELRGILLDYQVYYVEKVFKGFWPEDTLMTLEDQSVVGVNDLSQVFLLKLREGHDIFKLITSLQKYQDCYFAEPNGYIHGDATPNDDLFHDQWNLFNWHFDSIGVGCQTAWEYNTRGGRIGILDSGIDWTHPEFACPNYPGYKIPQGYDFVNDDHYPFSNVFHHATACAGIAAARTNTDGIAGISGGWARDQWDWGSQIIPMQIIDDSNHGNIADACDAIRAAADPDGPYNCVILSNSWGDYNYSEALRGAVCYANIAERTFVASKGNDETNDWHYPSDIDGSWVISVGAYQNSPGAPRAGFSNYGNNIDLLAPSNVITTVPGWPGGDYDWFVGTSASCPHVSGAAALLRARLAAIMNPPHPDDVDRILCYSAVDGGVPGYDDYYGNGRLNIGNALSRLSHLQPIYPPWQIFAYHTSPGYDEIASISDGYGAFNNKAPYDLPTGHYFYRKYEIRVNVDYDKVFMETPKAWGRGMNVTRGWSPAIPNNMAEYCGVISGSESIDGCVLQTWVYEIWQSPPPNAYLGWFPCPPEEVECEYVVWGRLDPNPPPPPLRPDSGESKIQIVSNIAENSEDVCPNPFNDQTEINLNLTRTNIVAITVHDILGQVVCKIYSGKLNSGSHRFLWMPNVNSGNLGSGVYFIKIAYPEETKVLKVTYLK